jgi:hypothetical protein
LQKKRRDQDGGRRIVYVSAHDCTDFRYTRITSPQSGASTGSVGRPGLGNCSVASTVSLKNSVLGLGLFSFVGLKRSRASIANFAAQFDSFGFLRKPGSFGFYKKKAGS